MMAHSLQFLLRASLSSACALLFMLKAVSLILELFSSISYVLCNMTYMEVLLVLDHHLHVVAHQLGRLVHDRLRCRHLVALLAVQETRHQITYRLFARIEVGLAFEIRALEVDESGDLLQKGIGS